MTTPTVTKLDLTPEAQQALTQAAVGIVTLLVVPRTLSRSLTHLGFPVTYRQAASALTVVRLLGRAARGVEITPPKAKP